MKEKLLGISEEIVIFCFAYSGEGYKKGEKLVWNKAHLMDVSSDAESLPIKVLN